MQAFLGVSLEIDGTEDVECLLTENSKKGVEIMSSGFFLNDVTITITSMLDEDTVVTLEDDNVVQALVGENFRMTKVTLSGFTPGSYTVLFIR